MEEMLVAMVKLRAEDSGRESTDEEESGGSLVESATAILESLRPTIQNRMEISWSLNEGDGKASRSSAIIARSS